MACEAKVRPAWKSTAPRLLLWSDRTPFSLATIYPTHCWASTGPSVSEVPNFQDVMEKVDLFAQLCIGYFVCLSRNAGARIFSSKLSEHVLSWQRSL